MDTPERTTSDDMLLTIREVAACCFMSQRSVYRMMAAGDFPRPIRLTRQRVAWRQTDIKRWKDERPRA